MLVAETIRAEGRHTPLLPTTSLDVDRGELLLVRAVSSLTRTGLALMLTGRMKTAAGTISWDGDGSRRALRRSSGVVDSPGVNAMERHQRVRDYAAEMLSYIRPSPLRGTGLGAWLAENCLGELEDLWDEELTGEQRLRLACALARADEAAELLVFDTPSRHGEGSEEPDAWLAQLLDLAGDEKRPRAVVAIVPDVPASWEGAVAEVGADEEPAASSATADDEAASPEASASDDAASDDAAAVPEASSTGTAASEAADSPAPASSPEAPPPPPRHSASTENPS